jgi:hypothetical protein
MLCGIDTLEQCVKRNVSPLEEHLPLKDASSSTKFYTKKVAQININNQCVERNVSPLEKHLLFKNASFSKKIAQKGCTNKHKQSM